MKMYLKKFGIPCFPLQFSWGPLRTWKSRNATALAHCSAGVQGAMIILCHQFSRQSTLHFIHRKQTSSLSPPHNMRTWTSQISSWDYCLEICGVGWRGASRATAMKSNSTDYKWIHAGHRAVQTLSYKSTSVLKQKVPS